MPAWTAAPGTPTASEAFEQVSGPRFELEAAKCFDCAGLVGDGVAFDRVSDREDDRVKAPGMGDTGLEDVQKTTGSTAVAIVCNAESNADAAGLHIPVAQDDPDLTKLIGLWGGLPAETPAGILRLSAIPTKCTGECEVAADCVSDGIGIVRCLRSAELTLVCGENWPIVSQVTKGGNRNRRHLYEGPYVRARSKSTTALLQQKEVMKRKQQTTASIIESEADSPQSAPKEVGDVSARVSAVHAAHAAGIAAMPLLCRDKRPAQKGWQKASGLPQTWGTLRTGECDLPRRSMSHGYLTWLSQPRTVRAGQESWII